MSRIVSRMSSDTKPTRGRPKKLNREQVIQFAIKTYWVEGLFALSFNELCQQANVSKPAMYREFGSEDGLMDAVLDYYLASHMSLMLAGLKHKPPFALVMAGAIDHLTSDRDVPNGCMFARMRASTGRLGPLTITKIKKLEQVQRLAYQNWFEAGLKKGEVNDALEPEFAARFIDTQFSTLLMLMSDGADPAFVNAQSKLAMQALLK